MCELLARAILDGINTRFNYIFSDPKAKLAAVVNSQFKIDWIDNLGHKAEVVQTLKHVCGALSAVQTQPTHKDDAVSAQSAEQVSETTDFFAYFTLQWQKQNALANDDSSAEVDRYLGANSPELLSLAAYPNIKKLYQQLNTRLPASVAVEHLCSLGRCVFTPLRSRLSNDHFEMMVFLRAAK